MRVSERVCVCVCVDSREFAMRGPCGLSLLEVLFELQQELQQL